MRRRSSPRRGGPSGLGVRRQSSLDVSAPVPVALEPLTRSFGGAWWPYIAVTRHIVIATGSESVIPPIPGLRELDGVWANREATGARDVPESIVILGGGSVGVEMAQAFATLGASVDLVEGMGHILPREPRPLGDALAEGLAGDRLRIHLGRRAASVARDRSNYVVRFEDDSELAGERLLVATGRRPRVNDLGLENVRIEAGPHGIPVEYPGFLTLISDGGVLAGA